MDWQLLCPSGSDGNDAESANLFRRLIISWTTRTVVCFSSTFGLPDVDGPQPAGSYRVDHDEESIESLSRLAWGRVSSFIYLPGIGHHGTTHQMVPINPVDLDAALEKDQKNHAGFDHSSA
jgi:hypothetical protein